MRIISLLAAVAMGLALWRHDTSTAVACLIIYACMLGLYGIMWLSVQKHRRPGESLRKAFRRSALSAAETKSAHCNSLTCNIESGDTLGCPAKLHNAFVDLDCGHHVMIKVSQPPNLGDTVWCPGHRRFGPAEQHVITAMGLKTAPSKKTLVAMR